MAPPLLRLRARCANFKLKSWHGTPGPQTHSVGPDQTPGRGRCPPAGGLAARVVDLMIARRRFNGVGKSGSFTVSGPFGAGVRRPVKVVLVDLSRFKLQISSTTEAAVRVTVQVTTARGGAHAQS